MAYAHRKNKTREGNDPGQDEIATKKKRASIASRISKANAPRKKVTLDKSFGLQVRGEEKIVRISRVRPNKWNPNRMSPFSMTKLRENIRTVGFIDPILVRSGNESGPFPDGDYEIIDGEQRYTAAAAENLNKVKVTDLGNVSDESAKVLTITFNDLRGKHDRDALAVIVGELSKLDNGDDFIGLLPYDEAEIDSLKTLGASDFDDLAEMPPEENDRPSGRSPSDEEDDLASILELDSIKPRRAASIAARLEALREYLADNPQHKEDSDRPGGLLELMLHATEAHYDIEAVPSDESEPSPKKR